MRLLNHPAFKFDQLLPIYNWLYPLSGQPLKDPEPVSISKVFASIPPPRGRALYFHIPFCETICSFCPFVRGKYDNESAIKSYVTALLNEIKIKGSFQNLAETPIRAIFFGGGTPSLLNPDQIRRIGSAIHSTFDLTGLREFSFEFEVKSITYDKLVALCSIGVTHARFGLQTLSEEYRSLFNLTATIAQLESAAKSLKATFPYVSCDVLYGMSGQTTDDLLKDIEGVCNLGLDNIDFYPINNVVTQYRLHKALRDCGKEPLSGLTKFYMNGLIREAMKERGYLPHNGHGYVRVSKNEILSNPVTTDSYSFIYHEHVYGYPSFDLLGFGNNAVSSFAGLSVYNVASRSEYIRALSDNQLPLTALAHGTHIDACRPLSLALPYHGHADKDWIDWGRIPDSLKRRLNEVIAAGLVIESDRSYTLTQEGWNWYTSLMYYLMPPEESAEIDAIVARAARDPRRTIETSGLDAIFAS